MAKRKPRLPQIQFKDPDLLFHLAAVRHPNGPDDPLGLKGEQAREKFGEEYTDFWDYGAFEIDPATLTGRLLPKKEWR